MQIEFSTKTFFAALLVFAYLALSGCGSDDMRRTPNDSGGTPNDPVGTPNDPVGGGSPGQLRFSTSVLAVSEAAGNVTLMIDRVNGTSGAISVTVASANGTATAGQDYRALATAVSFADGDAAPKSVTLVISDDTADEPDETLAVTLSNPTGGAILQSPDSSTTTVMINDDDVVPTATSLIIGAQPKRLTFSWLPVNNVTTYKLLMRLSPTADFALATGQDLAADVTSQRLGFATHLYPWTGVVPEYRLDSCSPAGCTPSSVVSPQRVFSVSTTTYIKASDTRQDARFGSSVAVSANGKSVAIGAPFANSGAGVVYVYLAPDPQSPPGRTPVRIEAPSTQAMHFGAAVALSPNGGTLVVGAPFDDNSQTGMTYPATPNTNASHSGGVFVYRRNPGVPVTFSAPVYIKASDADAGDEFGAAVALRDTILIIGAPRQDSPTADEADVSNTATDSGAAYAYFAGLGQWIPVPGRLKASNVGNGDLFGSSVAVSEGGSIVIVGAPREDGDGTDSGAAYRFVKVNDSANTPPAWNPPQRFKATSSGAGNHYGTAVAVSGNGNVFAAGAPNEDDANNLTVDTGAVYVYTATGGAIVDVARLTARHIFANALYGSSLALNSDGFILAAGSPNESANQFGIDGDADDPQPLQGSGAVDVLWLQGASWSAQGGRATIAHYLKGPLPDAQDGFGVAVGMSRDGNTLVVGANGEDSSGTNVDSGQGADNSAVDSGAAYLF